VKELSKRKYWGEIWCPQYRKSLVETTSKGIREKIEAEGEKWYRGVTIPPIRRKQESVRGSRKTRRKEEYLVKAKKSFLPWAACERKGKPEGDSWKHIDFRPHKKEDRIEGK